MFSIASNRCPFGTFLSLGNRKKSHGARSGEYGGCCNWAVPCLAKNCCTRCEACVGALSWCRMQSPSRHFSGHFRRTDCIAWAHGDPTVIRYLSCCQSPVIVNNCSNFIIIIIIIIIIIVIIFINWNWVITRWQCLLYMSANMKMVRTNMKMVNTKFRTGGLHEKHVVATWNLGNRLSICL